MIVTVFSFGRYAQFYLNEGIYVNHQCLGPRDDELIDTGDGMGSNLGGSVLEELKELGNQKVEGSIQCISVEHFGTEKKII